MLFWILVFASIVVAIIFCVDHYYSYPFDLGKALRRRRRKELVGAFFGGLFVGCVCSVVIFAMVVFFGFGLSNPKPTIVKQETLALAPVGQSDVRMLSEGTEAHDDITFRVGDDLNATKSDNRRVEISTDLAGLEKPHVIKTDTKTYVRWIAPFPLDGTTKYEAHILPNQISGVHVVTVR